MVVIDFCKKTWTVDHGFDQFFENAWTIVHGFDSFLKKHGL